MDPRGRLRYPIHVVYQRLDLAPFAQVGVHIVVVHGASAVDIDQPGILEDAQVMSCLLYTSQKRNGLTKALKPVKIHINMKFILICKRSADYGSTKGALYIWNRKGR